MILTPAELSDSAVPDPEVAAFLSTNPLPTSDPNDYTTMRNGLKMIEARIKTKLGPVAADISENYHAIAMRDGWSNPVKIVKPTTQAPGPLFILIHAGGFVGGSNEQLTDEARALAHLFGATVVNISYRLAPEHKFPTPQFDVWDCCKWISDHASEPLLRSDPEQGFVLGGVSVGGSMSAALSRKFQDEPLSHALTGQWLSVGSLMDESCVPARFKNVFLAREQSSDAPLLNKDNLAALQRLSEWDSASDLRYAINSKSDMSQQPRTYLQVGALDPYRDDTLIYHELLSEAGVETRLDFYAGCPHLHWMIMPHLSVSKRTRIETLLGLGWLLGRNVDRKEVANELGLEDE
ncbi:hypothetical protein Q7P37_000526 [Cladosporium fusiforme]